MPDAFFYWNGSKLPPFNQRYTIRNVTCVLRSTFWDLKTCNLWFRQPDIVTFVGIVKRNLFKWLLVTYNWRGIKWLLRFGRWRFLLFPCGCFLPFIEGIIFLPIQRSCFLLVGAIPTYSRCFKSHSNIPTTPPQSYITYRFWPKKTVQQTNERRNKTKHSKPKTQQNKIQQANKQTSTSYPLPSNHLAPLKKKPADRYQNPPAAPRGRLPCFGSNSTGLIPPLVPWLQPSRPSRP